MKFWCFIVLFMSLTVYFGKDSSNSLGDKITSNLSKISEGNFKNAIRNKETIQFVTADDHEVLTYASITPIRNENTEETIEEVINDQVLYVFIRILEEIPSDCEKTSNQLHTRYYNAVREKHLDFEKLARWVDFAGKSCLKMPKASGMIRKYKGLYFVP